MNETLSTVDSRPVLRIERRLAHPPEKVWRALTEPDQLSKWYPFQTTEIDLRVGATIHFSDGQGMTMDAVITEVDAPRVFAFSEHAPAEMTRESDDLVRFELKPDGEGCLLIFTQVFDDRPAAASYATGWTGCLEVLRQILDGQPIAAPADWAARHERYVEEFGLDAGTAEVAPEGWVVRFDRQLMQAPIDKVWQTLTASAGTPEVGGEVPEAFTTKEISAGPVMAADAPHVLEYGWRSGELGGRVRWELSTGPGGARIVLTQTGPAALPDERSTALTAWQSHLNQLARRLREA